MKKFWEFFKKFLLGHTEVTESKRAASLKCPGCDGWTELFTETEKLSSKFVYIEGTDLAHLTCGRCCAVSEWYMGAPVAIFQRMLLPVSHRVMERMRVRAEDLQAEHNLFLLSMANPVEPIWDAYTNYTYAELAALIQQLETRIEHLRELTSGNAHV